MAKVYDFPVRKLPAVVEERLYKCAEDYIEVVKLVMQLMDIGDPSEPGYDEVVEMVATTYAEGMIEAIDKME